MLQNNKTRGREVKGNLLGRYRQRGPRWKTNGSLDWFSLFQAFRCTFSWNIVASGSNWRTRRKRNGEGVSNFPLASTPYPSSPGCFFLLIFLCTYPESRGLRSPPHYPQSHFVLRVRESRDYSRKTTSRKNDLYRVEPPYLLPLLPLSSNIIRVIVRNVPVWESYITHLSHDRLRAA